MLVACKERCKRAAHEEVCVEENDMTDEEKEQMAYYGVTAVQETVYLFNGAKYRDLKDALNYAELLAKREKRIASIASN